MKKKMYLFIGLVLFLGLVFIGTPESVELLPGSNEEIHHNIS